MADIKNIVEEISAKHGNKRTSLIPILQGIIKSENHLSNDAMTEVARVLDISAAEVYGVASFYSFLETKVDGQYKIYICKSIICDMKGKDKIIKVAENMLNIKLGETSPCKKFSLLETNCLGLCDKGPAMLINDDFYTELTPTKVQDILGKIQKHGECC